MISFIPSFHGDISLREEGKHTLLSYEKISAEERRAIVALSVHGEQKKWFDAEAARELSEILDGGRAAFRVNAPLHRVQKYLAQALKPSRRIVSVIFKEGVVEEIVDQTANGEVETVKTRRKKTDGAVGASVAAPVRGCPPPDFEAAEIRAAGVLAHFLSGEQREDFLRFNRFVTYGASGRRYMITSRQARDQLSKYQRTLYDLDYDAPICTHDWEVPAAEEMLTMHLLVQMPDWEEYLRSRPNTIEDGI